MLNNSLETAQSPIQINYVAAEEESIDASRIKGSKSQLKLPINEATPLYSAAAENSDSPSHRRLSVMNSIRRVSALNAEEIKQKAEGAYLSLWTTMLKARNNMKSSPWIVSLVVSIMSFGIIWIGLFDIISYIIRLRPFSTVLKVYQVGFAVLCLAVESSRYVSLFSCRSFIHRWIPFAEIHAGRGVLQCLTAGLALGTDFKLAETLPAIVLACLGVFNISWGIKGSLQLSWIMTELKKEMGHQGIPISSLLLMQNKFSALDLNGDGRISKDELQAACKSLKLDLDQGQLEVIFSLLDPANKGYIDISDFELWWLQEKHSWDLLV